MGSDTGPKPSRWRSCPCFATILSLTVIGALVVYYRSSGLGVIDNSSPLYISQFRKVEKPVPPPRDTHRIVWPELATKYTEDSLKYDNLLNVIKSWNPDDAEIPANFTERLQHFNYSCPVQRAVAQQYLKAEMPFKVYNVPEFDLISSKWTDEYLIEGFKKHKGHVEKAETNHFMFWHAVRGKSDYKPPTDLVQMKFPEWLTLAKKADAEKLSSEAEHYYFTTGVKPRDRSMFIGRDLTLFSTSENNFFVRDVSMNKGIQCRFGMRGINAAAHYDAGRNMVAVFRGHRRYILTPPHTCPKLSIIAEKKHPSFRHSVLDWSSIPQAISSGWATVDAIDTIMNPGEVLYIPSFWFHYIVSLDYSIQCNTRHGSPPSGIGKREIDECFSR